MMGDADQSDRLASTTKPASAEDAALIFADPSDSIFVAVRLVRRGLVYCA